MKSAAVNKIRFIIDTPNRSITLAPFACFVQTQIIYRIIEGKSSAQFHVCQFHVKNNGDGVFHLSSLI
jgi:hypothetical protein